ncbi:hypothetical protein [Tabrizicola sp.]|uniref:hypothetical protein n=1 Tax=Tabrizicola sp. TaxID=2005166 RepID=UPI003D27A3C9
MTAAPLSSLNVATITTLPSDAVEPTAVAIATEIDRLEALLAVLQRRLAQTPIPAQTDKETLHALS